MSVIGGDFVLESVVRCAGFVRYSEFGGCPLFGSRKCTASTGIAVGTSTVVRYSEEVRYWEGPLSEVPLYTGQEGDTQNAHVFQHFHDDHEPKMASGTFLYYNCFFTSQTYKLHNACRRN